MKNELGSTHDKDHLDQVKTGPLEYPVGITRHGPELMIGAVRTDVVDYLSERCGLGEKGSRLRGKLKGVIQEFSREEPDGGKVHYVASGSRDGSMRLYTEAQLRTLLDRLIVFYSQKTSGNREFYRIASLDLDQAVRDILRIE